MTILSTAPSLKQRSIERLPAMKSPSNLRLPPRDPSVKPKHLSTDDFVALETSRGAIRIRRDAIKTIETRHDAIKVDVRGSQSYFLFGDGLEAAASQLGVIADLARARDLESARLREQAEAERRWVADAVARRGITIERAEAELRQRRHAEAIAMLPELWRRLKRAG